MPAVVRSTLRVEGADDAHTIMHLLRQRGCICPVGREHREVYSDNAPLIQPAGGVSELLDGMAEAVRFSSGRSVGFVLDADEAASDRWQRVCETLRAIGLKPPHEIPNDGYIEYAGDYQVHAGVWLMPDNRRPGALEAFLQDLMDVSDPLRPIAERSTDDARRAGAQFPDSRRDKAVLRTWLAWQEEPGLPYGLAVSRRYFQDTALVDGFAGWFRRLFECG